MKRIKKLFNKIFDTLEEPVPEPTPEWHSYEYYEEPFQQRHEFLISLFLTSLMKRDEESYDI